MKVFTLAIFVSAFLLFQVQPLIGKYILPWFGSAPGVWTTAVLFFQVLLLAGYAYAHLLARYFSNRAQALTHLALLAGALLLLPITPSEWWKPDADDNPTWQILLLLTASVGGPYLLLAATSPLLQAWVAHVRVGDAPYRLYAVSNAGSLLALLSYPFLFERFFPLQTQTWVWSAGFGVFALLGGFCAWRLMKARTDRQARDAAPGDRAKKRRRVPNAADAAAAIRATQAKEPPTDTSPRFSRLALWLALSATGSVMLLATMNRMSQDVPAVPFLFVLPLSLYLVTFIIAFDHERWYYRPVFCTLLLLASAGACVALYLSLDLGLKTQIALYAAALFACCMACHGELARLKPDPKHLTLFYLMVSLGGALGGLFVAVLAPNLFDGYWEYEIGLAAAYGLVMSLVGRDLLRRSRRAPQTQERSKKADKRSGSNARRRKQKQQRRPRAVSKSLGWALSVAAGLGFFLLVGVLGWRLHDGRDNLVDQVRNFYGVLRVVEEDIEHEPTHKYKLKHGQIQHGFQYLLPERRTQATSYFGPQSGVGIALNNHPARTQSDRSFRLGVVGLGAGILATYANAGQPGDTTLTRANDYLLFYEINPNVLDFADTYFTFVRDARARGADVDVRLGDARIEMERQLERGEPQQFDVLVLDAFSGDAIPMHLLTKEAFAIYLAHLKPDGILAVHVTNRHVNLLPVVRTLAHHYGLPAHLIRHDGDQYGSDFSLWILVTQNEAFFAAAPVQQVSTSLDRYKLKTVMWTDDSSSLFQVLVD